MIKVDSSITEGIHNFESILIKDVGGYVSTEGVAVIFENRDMIIIDKNRIAGIEEMNYFCSTLGDIISQLDGDYCAESIGKVLPHCEIIVRPLEE